MGNFRPLSRRFSESLQDRVYRLLMITNRKSYTRFRIVPKLMTLDDLEQPMRTLLHVNIDLNYQRPGTLMRIFVRFLWRGGVKR